MTTKDFTLPAYGNRPRADATEQIRVILDAAARSGYSPELILLELKDWFGRDTVEGLSFDERALYHLSRLPHPFPFSISPELLAIDVESLIDDRESLQALSSRLLHEGFSWSVTDTTYPDALLMLLSKFQIGSFENIDGLQIGRNRLEKARAAYLAFAVSVSDPHDLIVLTENASRLSEALRTSDTQAFMTTISATSRLFHSVVSVDILIELLFALLGIPVLKQKLTRDRQAQGLFAVLRVVLSGGARRIFFLSSLADAKRAVDFCPGENPSLLIECGH